MCIKICHVATREKTLGQPRSHLPSSLDDLGSQGSHVPGSLMLMLFPSHILFRPAYGCSCIPSTPLDLERFSNLCY